MTEAAGPATPPPVTRRARWIAAAAVIAIGVGVAYLASAERERPKTLHTVTVLLTAEVTADQRAAVEEGLRAFNPIHGPEFKDSQEVAARADELYQDDPEARDQIADTPLPGMIIVITESRTIDCGPLPALRTLPGVQHIMIDGIAAEPGTRFGATACP